VRLRALALATALCGLVGLSAFAQQPPADRQRPVIEAFREIRDLVNDGRFEVAAESIKDFLGLNPTDQDYLDIEARFGPTAILRLGTVPRWYDDDKRDAEFQAGPLKTLLEGSRKANKNLLRDPRRVQRYVYNLGATREEYLFAVQELRRSGDFVVPIMVSTLRTDETPELRQGILAAIRELGMETVPGFIAATDGLSPDLSLGIFRSLAGRPDVLALAGRTDTDFTPNLWYLASSPTVSPSITRAAADLLRQVTGETADIRQAATELVNYATPLYERKGQFAMLDRVRNRVRFWEWDPTAQTVRAFDITPAEAEERLGLKYLRWAVERQPDDESAQKLFIALAIERAVERANFGNLATAEPDVYRVVVNASGATLVSLLETALAENRTAQSLGLIQVLGDRAERLAATPLVRTGSSGETLATRAAPLVRALNYPDPRVQLAAAIAILRIPNVSTGANARIVEILMRAVSGDPPGGPQTRGRALLADPRIARADQIAEILRSMGYQTEQFGTGRELLRRVQQSSDFDLVLVDRHIANPELRDVLAQLSADANFARRPLAVIASSDRLQTVGVEQILLRLALLIAVTETEDIPIPALPIYDARKTADLIAEERRQVAQERDQAFNNIYRARLGRLRRIVEASGIVRSDQIQARLDLRLPQLTYAALIAEYAPPPDTAPMLYREFDRFTALLRAQPDLDRALDNSNTDNLIKIALSLETVLTPELQQTFETLRKRVDVRALGIRVDSTRDPEVEFALVGIVRNVPNAVIIPEPYTAVGFQDDLRTAVSDPSQLPRDPAEKRAAEQAAVEWLRKLAVGDVPGYDVRPATGVLRRALADDELAEPAIDALGRIPMAEAQQALLEMVIMQQRPITLRLKAAEVVTQHIQNHGRLTSPELIARLPRSLADEQNVELRSRMEIIRTHLAGAAGDLPQRIQQFRIPPPADSQSETTDPKPDTKNDEPPTQDQQ
jgi:CheY-like chemotaxis protein